MISFCADYVERPGAAVLGVWSKISYHRLVKSASRKCIIVPSRASVLKKYAYESLPTIGGGVRCYSLGRDIETLMLVTDRG